MNKIDNTNYKEFINFEDRIDVKKEMELYFSNKLGEDYCDCAIYIFHKYFSNDLPLNYILETMYWITTEIRLCKE